MRFSDFVSPLLLIANAAAVTASSMTNSLAPHLGVSIEALDELLSSNSTEHLSSIDATKWATVLDQPVDILASWDEDTKYRMFSFLQVVISEGPDLDKRGISQSEASRAETDIRNREQVAILKLNDEEQQDKIRCSSKTNCILCIGAAGSVGIGVVAGCAATGLAAEQNLVGNSPTATNLTTAIVIAQFISCISRPVAAFLVATGVCLTKT